MLKKFVTLLKKDEKGLTLVELLAVVVILAIVGAIAFVAVGNVIDNSRQDAHVANAQQLISAAKLAEASNTAGFPSAGYTTGTVGANQLELDTVETLTNPWDADDTTYVGTVTKDGDVYKVSITGAANTIECDITTETEANVNQGRDAVCAAGTQS